MSHLNEDGEEQEQGLIGRRQVNTAVEADKEDALHQQGGEDDGVGQTHAQPRHGTGHVARRQGLKGRQQHAHEHAQQQHLRHTTMCNLCTLAWKRDTANTKPHYFILAPHSLHCMYV